MTGGVDDHQSGVRWTLNGGSGRNHGRASTSDARALPAVMRSTISAAACSGFLKRRAIGVRDRERVQ
jgi:hypothetical protein